MKEKVINVEYFAHLPSKRAVGWLSVPVNEPGQKIKSIFLTPKPNSKYNDKFRNQICYFRTLGSSLDVNLKLGISFEKYSLKGKSVKFPKKGKIFALYTKSETFLKHTVYIKNLAKKILENNQGNKLASLQEAFIFTVKNFKYQYPVTNRGTEYMSEDCLNGDCGEYTAFLVTLARCLGIPARPSTGFVLYPKTKKVMEHAWASVYISGFGWADLDAQYAALEKDSNFASDKYFLARTDQRISFTNGYNILLKPSIPKSYSTSFWNKAGLPLNRISVQTLQPFIFAFKGTLRFKSSMKYN